MVCSHCFLTIYKLILYRFSYLDEQVNHFLEKGYIVLKNAFTKEKAAEWTETIWVRLGLDPDDKSTWTRERIHMPHHRRELVKEFSPAVCLLF